jgi:hypothetical protein
VIITLTARYEDGLAFDRRYVANMSKLWQKIHDPIAWRRKLDEFELETEVITNNRKV